MEIKIKHNNYQLIIMTATNAKPDKTGNLIYTKLSIISLNINGLFEDNKRNKLFVFLNNKKSDILPLPETHSTTRVVSKWKKEWTGESYWNSGQISKSSGVAIPLKNNLTQKLLLSTKMMKEEFFP